MSRLSLVSSFILLASAEAFCPLKRSRAISAMNVAPPDRPAGSFFHQIPDDNEGYDEDEENNSGDVNDEVTKLLRERRKPLRASKPSTINGVPTAKATGENLSWKE